MYTIIPNSPNWLFFDKFDLWWRFNDHNSDVKMIAKWGVSLKKVRIFDQKMIENANINNYLKRHVLILKPQIQPENCFKSSLVVFQRSVEMIYTVWKWIVSDLKKKLRCVITKSTWIPVLNSSFSKNFLHVFKYQKIFQKISLTKFPKKTRLSLPDPLTLL